MGPVTTIEFLGLELDSLSMEARLPRDKLLALRAELQFWSLRDTCTLLELQSLLGYLHFCLQVIPYSRSFLRRLINFSTTFPTSFVVRRIPLAAKKDLRWWLEHSLAWNGIQLVKDGGGELVEVFTDASGTKGIGGSWDREWFSLLPPPSISRRTSSSKRCWQFGMPSAAGVRGGDAVASCFTSTTKPSSSLSEPAPFGHQTPWISFGPSP